MSRYNADFPFNVAFPPQAMTNVLAEWLSKQGVKQAHIAETEKYAHVTFFFNGGVEKQFEHEERHMIPSPKVATYDKEPKMSVRGVAEKVAEVVRDLWRRDQDRGLSAGEKRMLAKARQILVSELALAEHTNEDKAEATLDEVLAS